MDYTWIALICSVVGLAFAVYLVFYVLKWEQGPEIVRTISAAIQEGAAAFLKRQYRILAIFVVVVAIIMGILLDNGWISAGCFAFGAVCSGLSGFIGMNIAVRTNRRTAHAATSSLNNGLKVAFRGGAVMGICVVSIGLLGLSILYFILHNHADFIQIFPAYGMGASSVAIFARVGGGIYTKAADTGSDLVGKVEKSIPEDDPRNAAVIADLVGDNVGDVAGMGADLFESYVDSIIAVVVLGAIATVPSTISTVAGVDTDMIATWLPMLLAAAGIVASIIGVFMVKVGEKLDMNALLGALRRGVWSASILAAIFAFLIIYFMDANIGIFWAILAGLVAGVAIGESTNYFTSYTYKPTKSIAEAAKMGAGPVITKGFAMGLLSNVGPIILVVVAIIIAYNFADIYGVAIAGIGMLSTLGVTLATDAYGPVADNAGGIAEMAGLPKEVRERTDALDSLGNTTAATGKGFAIGSAGLTALVLMLAYAQAVNLGAGAFDLLDPMVIVGLLIGAMYPAVFCALTMNAVGTTAGAIITEVRRQFKEIAGIMEGKAKPEYGKCVDICTKAAIKQMLLPGLLTVVIPIAVGLIFGARALGGFLMGATITGFIFAVTLSNAGGAWDNAKKYIEAGNFGGKRSDAHKAAVVGDTVGDPFKDTSGPSLNIMIKLMSIIGLVFAPLIVSVADGAGLLG